MGLVSKSSMLWKQIYILDKFGAELKEFQGFKGPEQLNDLSISVSLLATEEE